MRMRELIDLVSGHAVITEDQMDFSHSGKFWYNSKTGETYRVRGHHSLAAFEIPALAQVLEAALGSAYYDTFSDIIRRSAKQFFSKDNNDLDHSYLGLHDRVCDILCNAGFIRGINDLVFYVALASRYERACRKLVAIRSPQIVQFDLVDLHKSGELQGADVDVFVRGRSLKTFSK